jgi:transposase
MNKIRALLAQQREEVRVEIERRKERLFSIRGLAFLDQLMLPSEDKAVLDDLIKGYRELRDHIQMTDSAVEEVYEAMEEAARIDTVPGFGKTLAVVMAVEIADIRRFQRVEEFHSYAGLVPSTHSSGDRTFHGPITKQGNVWLRWAALEAAYPAIKKDLSLRHLYSRLAKRKGPNVAKIAVARRLLTIVYRLLTEKRDYVVEMKNITAA